MKKPRPRRTKVVQQQPSDRCRKATHIHGGHLADFYHDQDEDEEGFPVNEWIWENLERRNYSFQWHYYDGGVIRDDWKGVNLAAASIWFRREHDSILFTLRWQGHRLVGKKVPVDYDGSR